MAKRIQRIEKRQSTRIQRQSNNKPTRYYSSRQEKIVAERIKGQTTKNSGATMFSKGDILTEDYIVECKTKTKNSDSITIKKEWLDKLEEEALFMGKQKNALVFSFGPSSSNYYIISEELFRELNNLDLS